MKSINFEFLRPGNETLANLGGLAEAVLHIDPGSALTRLRSFAEELTKAIYQLELLPRLPQSSFYELVKNPVFLDCTSRSLVHQINPGQRHGARCRRRAARCKAGTGHCLSAGYVYGHQVLRCSEGRHC